MPIKILSTLAIIILTILYALFRAQSFIFGPTITILSPLPNTHVQQIVSVYGTVDDVVYLTINDIQVYPNRDGVFTEDIILPVGYSIVEVYAQNRHSKETTIHLPLYIDFYDTKEKNIEGGGDEEN